MSLVEALTLAPSELRLMEKEIKPPLVQSGSADLESIRSKASTGNFSMGDYSWLGPMLDATMECNMASYESNPHRFQLENHYAEYGNYPTSSQMAQMSRRPDHGYRG